MQARMRAPEARTYEQARIHDAASSRMHFIASVRMAPSEPKKVSADRVGVWGSECSGFPDLGHSLSVHPLASWALCGNYATAH